MNLLLVRLFIVVLLISEHELGLGAERAYAL